MSDVYAFPNWSVLQNLSSAPINPQPTMASLSAVPGPSNFGGIKQTVPNSQTFNKTGNIGPQGPKAIFHKARVPTS